MSVIGKLKVILGLDSSDFQRGTREAEQSSQKMVDALNRNMGNVDLSKAEKQVNQVANQTKAASEIIRSAAREGIDALRDSIAGSQAEIQRLSEQYKELQSQARNVAPGLAKSNLNKELNEVNAELRAEKQALAEAKDELSRMIAEQSKYEQSTDSFRTRLRDVRETMMTLREQGKQNTAEYKQQMDELKKLGTIQREVMKEFVAASTGATQWAGIISGVQGVAGAFSAAHGALALFNTDNEKLVEIQTKLQGIMAVLIGMQQLSNTLHATSAFRITTVTKITNLFTAAQTKLAVALGISTVAAKALMAALTLGISVAITAIVAAISALSSEASKAKKEIEDFSKAVSDIAAEPLASFKMLQVQWNALGDDLEAKKRLISDNKSEFDKLGVSIEDVTDADNLFIQNAQAFEQSIMQRAIAAATMDVVKEKYKAAIQEMIDAEVRLNAAQAMEGPETMYRTVGVSHYKETTEKGKAIKEAKEDFSKAKLELENIGTSFSKTVETIADNINNSTTNLIKAGIKTTSDVIKGSVEDFENQISEWKNKLKKAVSAEEYKQVEGEIKKLEALKEKITGAQTKKTQVKDNSLAAQEAAVEANIAALQKEQGVYGNTIAYLEKMLQLRQQQETYAKSEAEYQKIKKENDQLERRIELTKAVYESGSRRDIEKRISDAEAEMQRINTATADGAKKWGELNKQVKQYKGWLERLPKDYAAGSVADLQARISSIKKQLENLNPDIDSDKIAELRGMLVVYQRLLDKAELKVKVDVAYPKGSLGELDQQISDLTEKTKTQTGADLEATTAALKLAQARREVMKTTIEGSDRLTQAIARLREYEAELAKAEESTKAYWQGMVDSQREVVLGEIAKLKMLGELEHGVKGMVSGIGEALGNLATGDYSDATSALLNPIADMLIQLGKLSISTGITLEALRESFKWFKGVGAVIAGTALVALGTAVKNKIGAMPEQSPATGGGGGYNTFTGGGYSPGYSNNGAYRYAVANVASAGTNVTVDVKGALKGEDIALAVKKVTYNKSR